jgi:hypothetical protein
LFGIVPLSPRPEPLENVSPLNTSPCAAVPALTVARLASHALRLLLQVLRLIVQLA